ncbi:hypothetical protein T265_15480, partial [Opisthorchis viverrini]
GDGVHKSSSRQADQHPNHSHSIRASPGLAHSAVITYTPMNIQMSSLTYRTKFQQKSRTFPNHKHRFQSPAVCMNSSISNLESSPMCFNFGARKCGGTKRSPTYALRSGIYALIAAADSGLLQPSLTTLPPVVTSNYFKHMPSQLYFMYPYLPYPFFPSTELHLYEVTKFSINMLCTPMDLSVMLFNALLLLAKDHTFLAIVAVAQPSLICVTETWLSVETPETAV